jgi:murein DD-endopeptidase MepM/ murein hydrolase activator NlpD
MKLAVGLTGLAVAGILSLPLLAVTGTGSPATAGFVGCGDMPRILETIRTQESGGNYQAQATGSTASGAYQIIDTTWAGWTSAARIGTEYRHAANAPPDIQDAVAAHQAQRILDQYHDVSMIPLVWYYPETITNPTLLDIVPMPEAGNTITPRQYQTSWLKIYAANAAGSSSACGTTMPGGEWALPFDRTIIDANPAMLAAPHHDYPAIDLPIPTGTPIYAIHAGTVLSVSTYSGNCYGNRDGCPDLCGTGLTIQDQTGTHWIYCHATTLTVEAGQHVAAGQQIMISGNTGHSSGPHLHLGIRTNGTNRCPQPLLQAIHSSTTPPTELPSTGCTT